MDAYLVMLDTLAEFEHHSKRGLQIHVGLSVKIADNPFAAFAGTSRSSLVA
jgi:transcription antitermination factor NusG